jgi:hypothetical protein
MKAVIELVVGVAAIVAVILLANRLRRHPRHLNRSYFNQQWNDLQKLCASQSTWELAVINADNLLDEALKKLHFKGKTMGERLVSAQHSISNNDAVWFGHKLRNSLVHETNVKLTKKAVKQALVGFRRALKDLRAL